MTLFKRTNPRNSGEKKIRLFFLLLSVTIGVLGQTKTHFPSVGIVSTPDHDTLLYKAGFHFLITSIGNYVSPRQVSDQQFRINLGKFKDLQLSLHAFNIFFPGDLKLVGPEMNENKIMEYAEVVFKRVKEAGVKMIVWGSGGARRIPDGFDKVRAIAQFTNIARKLAIRAELYQITLVLENLNSSETNFINTVAEALDIVKNVNHPNLRLNIDIYHMLRENESPDIIEKAREYIVHCEIAEKEHRSPPGTSGTDFRPYLLALKKAGYTGNVFLECDWKDLATQAVPARLFLENQIRDTFAIQH
jgi:sugar phosphate isomerase/epimerase